MNRKSARRLLWWWSLAVGERLGEARMSWHRLRVTAAEGADAEFFRVQRMFKVFFTDAGSPSGMALFMSRLSGNELLDFYFSPVTEDVAEPFLKLVYAQPCAPPSEDLIQLMGHADAQQRFRQGKL